MNSDIKLKILIIDDDSLFRKTLIYTLHGIAKNLSLSFQIIEADCLAKAFAKLHEIPCLDLIFVDKELKRANNEVVENGFKNIKRIKSYHPNARLIAVTGNSCGLDEAKAIKDGASMFFEKGLPGELTKQIITNEVKSSIQDKEFYLLRNRSHSVRTIDPNDGLDGLLRIPGNSFSVNQLNAKLRQFAITKEAVLLIGESGTGKSVAAKIIHNLAIEINKKNPPRTFKRVDMGNITPSLIESELFGHEKGSFTGADSKSPGLVLEADGGTLYLDEIQNLPISIQAKLLTLIENKTITPVGSNKEIEVDVRIICSANTSLHELVKKNLFLPDLYYRMCPLETRVPPIEERTQDIPEILKTIFDSVAEKVSYEVCFDQIPIDFIQFLMSNPPENNLRGVRNALSVLLTYGFNITKQKVDFSRWKDFVLPTYKAKELPERTKSNEKSEKKQDESKNFKFSELLESELILDETLYGYEKAVELFKSKLLKAALQNAKENRKTGKEIAKETLKISPQTFSNIKKKFLNYEYREV